jgi:nucleotide-binding universal stress UspA family protein
MKKLLVCTDFSEAALHAANYACAFANEYNFRSITLFHAYQTVMPTTGLPLDSYSPNEHYNLAMDQLHHLQQQLTSQEARDIVFNLRTEEMSLPEDIDDICREEHADMIVMGVTGKSKIEKWVMGSNAVSVSQNSHYPVLIVPLPASIQPIRKILFACDLVDVSASTPIGFFKEFLDVFNAELFVLNVENKNRKAFPQKPEETSPLHEILDKYNPEYIHITHDNVIAGVLEVAERNQVSLIVTIPKHYNLLQKVFHKSTSGRLIYDSAVPLLTLHK